MMKTMKLKKVAVNKQGALLKWDHEVYPLHGRTVTTAHIYVRSHIGDWRRLGTGASIRNPKDSPIPSDGIKFALTRAMEQAKLSKTRRKAVWSDFLAKHPPHTPKA